MLETRGHTQQSEQEHVNKMKILLHNVIEIISNIIL